MTSMFVLWAGALLFFGGPVTEVSITPMNEQTSVLIAIDGDFEFRDFLMEGPHRLVVDLIGAQNALPRDESPVNRGGIRTARSSQYSADIVRVVFELTDKIGYSVTRDQRGVRVTLETPEVADFESWSSGSSMTAIDPTNLTPETVTAPPQQSQAERIDLSYVQEPLASVLLAFANFSGKSVVLKLYGTTDVGGVVVIDLRKSDVLRDHASRN